MPAMIFVYAANCWGTSANSLSEAQRNAASAVGKSLAQLKRDGWYALAFPEGTTITVDEVFGTWRADKVPTSLIDQGNMQGGPYTLADIIGA